MKAKGQGKYATHPNFWPEYQHKVPEETQKTIYDQYNSIETLYAYCDMAIASRDSTMAVSSAYTGGGSVKVRKNYVYVESKFVKYNVYGELKAVQFALKHAPKHINRLHQKVVIYSDLAHIEKMMKKESTFKMDFLTQAQDELIEEFNRLCEARPDLDIQVKYLPTALHEFNPFYRASHNAARRLVRGDKYRKKA